MEILSKEIADQDGKGCFYGRYYAKTADISGYIHNYIIFCPKSNIRPVLHIPSYYKEIGQRIKENNYQLKIGIFPLSNMNLDQIFEIDKEMEEENENGLFRILSEIPLHGQDKLLLSRCKDAFQICKEKQVDIAVFPEMIFNRQMQEEIREYVKGCRYPDAVPLFTWMGTAWEKGSNENMNRMISRWFPKGTDFSKVPKKEIAALQDWMDHYPRKILGWKCPAEIGL